MMGKSGLTLRAGTDADVEACERALRLEGTARDLLRDAMRSQQALLALRNGQVVGVIAMHREFFRCPFISLVVVAESARRQGVGTQMIQAVEREVGTGKLFTSTNQSNATAQALFERSGFTRSGCVENLDPGDPELVYFKRVCRDLSRTDSDDVVGSHGERRKCGS